MKLKILMGKPSSKKQRLRELSRRSVEKRTQEPEKQWRGGPPACLGFEEGWQDFIPQPTTQTHVDDDIASADHSAEEALSSSLSSASEPDDYAFGFYETSDSSDSFEDELTDYSIQETSQLEPPSGTEQTLSMILPSNKRARKYVPSQKLKSYELLSRSEKWKRKERFGEFVRQSICSLFEEGKRVLGQGNRKIEEIIRTQINLILPESLQAVSRNSLESWKRKIVQEFLACSKKSYRRIILASKIFDEQGNLFLYEHPEEAQQALKCCRSTYKRAQTHAELYGPGVGGPQIKRSRASAIQQISEELRCFAESKQFLRISSCKVNSKGEPLSYLLCTVDSMFKLYREEHPNGCSRSMFYRFFSREKYERMNLVGGLCSVCDSSGYSVIKSIERISERYISDTAKRKTIQDRTSEWLRHARTELSGSVDHLSCRSHCYQHAMGLRCDQQHDQACNPCGVIFEIIDELIELLTRIEIAWHDPDWTELRDLKRGASQFMAHRMRALSTNAIFGTQITNLQPGHAVIIIDFKQKFLKLCPRESQQEYFGKSAFSSFHGAAIISNWDQHDEVAFGQQQQNYCPPRYRRKNRVSSNLQLPAKAKVTFVDAYSLDTTQDRFWVLGVLELIANHLALQRREVKLVQVWADNATCYHNSLIVRLAPLIFSRSGITLLSLRYFEAGEGKSIVDRHFASVRHAVVNYVKNGHIFDSSTAIEKVLKQLAGVTTFSLEPNRPPGQTHQADSPKISAISTLHDFRYRYEADILTIEGREAVSDEVSGLDPQYVQVLRLNQSLLHFDGPDLPLFEGQIRLELTRGVLSPSNEGNSSKLLPPLVHTIYSANGRLRAENLSGNSDSTDILFPFGWAKSASSKKRGGKYPVLIQRALQYYFWMGQERNQRHLTPRQIYDAIAEHIRCGDIRAEIITIAQIKSWINQQGQHVRKKTNQCEKPHWFCADQPSCIWNISDQNLPIEPFPESSNSLQHSSEDEAQDIEPEEDRILFLEFPVRI
jgi:hypothetical protein